MNNIVYAKGLTDEILAEIRELDRSCCIEPLCMKLNWDMLCSRSDSETNDVLFYEAGKLVGYLGLYGFGSKPEEIETTGMVHPDYRRRGIFTKLFDHAIALSRSTGAGRLLLIAERQSTSGTGFAKNAGLIYSFSEYRMKCDAYQEPKQTSKGISLRPAEAGDTAFLQTLDEIGFGNTFPGGYERELTYIYIVEVNGNPIGKIGLNYENEMGYVFGVCLLPDYRGLGYGQAMLNAVLKKHFEAQRTAVILEVATKNDNALILYKTCGFKELTIYDYFEKIL